MNATPVIELKDVKVYHHARTGGLFRPNIVKAVDGVDFSISRGETVGIVGESGCGKSTLASVLVGLQPPTSGQVLFHGKPAIKRNAAMRKQFGRSVSVVFQPPSENGFADTVVPRLDASSAARIFHALRLGVLVDGARQSRNWQAMS